MDKMEATENTNFMQIVEGSQQFTSLEMILNYAKIVIKDDDLILSLENTIKAGYKLVKEPKEQFITLAGYKELLKLKFIKFFPI